MCGYALLDPSLLVLGSPEYQSSLTSVCLLGSLVGPGGALPLSLCGLTSVGLAREPYLCA